MSHETLDNQLFELRNHRVPEVDPYGAGATELFERIVSVSPFVEAPANDRDVAAIEVDFAPMSDPARPRSGRRILQVAATVLVLVCLVAVALLSVGLVRGGSQLASTGEADSGLSGGEAEGALVPTESSDGFLVGPPQPIVFIVSPGLVDDPARISECFELPLGGIQEDIGSPVEVTPLAYAGLLNSVSQSSEILFFNAGGLHGQCGDPVTSSGTGPTTVDYQPSPVIAQGSSALMDGSDLLISGSFEGLVDRDRVRSISVVGELVEQSFATVGPFFLLTFAVSNGSEPIPSGNMDFFLFEIEFLDGTTERGQWQDFLGRPQSGCAESGSCGRELRALGDQAEQDGSTEQARALMDGVLDQPEYAEAIGRFATCIERAGVRPTVEGFALVAEETSAADAVLACHRTELEFVERGAALQNRAVMESPR